MPTTAANNGNTRVTNAILATKLDALIDRLDRSAEIQERQTDLLAQATLVQDKRIGRLEIEQSRLDERVKNLRTNFARVQGIISTITAAGFAYIRTLIPSQ